MTTDTYLKYLFDVLRPFLIEKNIQLPIIVFAYSEYLNFSLDQCKRCINSGMQIISLYPKCNNIYHPFENVYSSILRSIWTGEAKNTTSAPVELPSFFHKLNEKLDSPEVTHALKMEFENCKILPFKVNIGSIPPRTIANATNATPIQRPCSNSLLSSKPQRGYVLVTTAHKDESAKCGTVLSERVVDAVELLEAFENELSPETIVRFHGFEGVWSDQDLNGCNYHIWKNLSDNANDQLISEMIDI